MYGCPAEFVLRNGRAFWPTEMTAEETAYVIECAGRAQRGFVKGDCFRNAQRLLFEGDWQRRLSYVEGYGCRKTDTEGPEKHGWLVLGAKVVDVTWRHEKPVRKGRLRDTVLGTWSPGEVEYFGVEMARAYVWDRSAH